MQNQLLVADAKLGNAIKEKLELKCVANSGVQELMRCIRSQSDSLLAGLPKKEMTAMALGKMIANQSIEGWDFVNVRIRFLQVWRIRCHVINWSFHPTRSIRWLSKRSAYSMISTKNWTTTSWEQENGKCVSVNFNLSISWLHSNEKAFKWWYKPTVSQLFTDKKYCDLKHLLGCLMKARWLTCSTKYFYVFVISRFSSYIQVRMAFPRTGQDHHRQHFLHQNHQIGGHAWKYDQHGFVWHSARRCWGESERGSWNFNGNRNLRRWHRQHSQFVRRNSSHQRLSCTFVGLFEKSNVGHGTKSNRFGRWNDRSAIDCPFGIVDQFG